MTKLTLGIVAGEPSGDNLAAGMMAAMRAALPDTIQIKFVGVGGPKMIAEGLESLLPMEQLTVNGFVDPLLRLPQLFKIYRRILSEMTDAKVDAFIGIDFNVFNFLLERSLKKRGIKTAHYVSPSVYAWRAGRTKSVARSADLLLCLYPFEPDFYRDTPIQTAYVGHPMADSIAPDAGSLENKAIARASLEIAQDAIVLAVLPGSRGSEVKLMMPHFWAAADHFAKPLANVHIVIPCVRPNLREQVEGFIKSQPLVSGAGVTVYDGDARLALVSADIALVKSGTSTLETLLLNRPMVVSYRLGKYSYHLAKRLIRSPFIALPNILAGRELVPELLQYEGSAENLSVALVEQLRDKDLSQREFSILQNELRQGADQKAATAVLALMGIDL